MAEKRHFLAPKAAQTQYSCGAEYRLYGSCPECLAVKTSYLGAFGYKASGYKKIHESANAIWGDVLFGCSWLLCTEIVTLEKIRSDITEKKLFVRVKNEE